MNHATASSNADAQGDLDAIVKSVCNDLKLDGLVIGFFTGWDYFLCSYAGNVSGFSNMHDLATNSTSFSYSSPGNFIDMEIAGQYPAISKIFHSELAGDDFSGGIMAWQFVFIEGGRSSGLQSGVTTFYGLSNWNITPPVSS